MGCHGSAPQAAETQKDYMFLLFYDLEPGFGAVIEGYEGLTSPSTSAQHLQIDRHGKESEASGNMSQARSPGALR